MRTGEVLPVRTRVQKILLGRDPVNVSTVTDLRRERIVREQMVRAEQLEAVSRMAGALSHDFNNLLAVVSASSQLARLGLDGGESAQRSARASLDTTDRAVDQAASLIRRMLEFGRGSIGATERIVVIKLRTPCGIELSVSSNGDSSPFNILAET